MDKPYFITLHHRKAPDEEYRQMEPGIKYVEVKMPHGAAVIRPEDAVQLADELIKASGLPYALINLAQKREDKPKIEPKHYPAQEPTKE